MSAIGQLLKLPQYARNLARLRQVLAVMGRHGFGHWLVRAGLDKYASPTTRGLALAESEDTALEELTWELRVRSCCEELGPTFVKLGQVAQPLRAALTGSTTSPGIDLTLAALGRDEALARIRAAAG